MKHSSVVVLVLSLLFPVHAAMAQFGGRTGFSEAFKPDLMPRDMPMIVEILKLEEWQRPIVQSLLEDYQISFKTGSDAVREKMVNAAKKQKGGSKGMKDLLEPIESWAPEKQRMYEELMASIKGQLSDSQQERWPKFERAILRTRSLDDADLAGEGIDLIAILRQMQVPADALNTASAAMDQYEVALDAALKARDAKINSLLPKFTAAMDAVDMEAGMALQEQIMAMRVAVRQVQDDSIEKIAVLLPAPYAEDFRTRALSQGYREVFQPDALANFFAAVLNLADLTTDQKKAVEAAEASWNASMAALQTRMLETTRAEEPNKAKRKTLSAAAKRAAKEGTTPPEVPSDPMIPLRNQKNQLVQDTREGVLKLLTKDQVDRLAAGNPELHPPRPVSTPAMQEGALAHPKAKPGGASAPGQPPSPQGGAPAPQGDPVPPPSMESAR